MPAPVMITVLLLLLFLHYWQQWTVRAQQFRLYPRGSQAATTVTGRRHPAKPLLELVPELVRERHHYWPLARGSQRRGEGGCPAAAAFAALVVEYRE